MTDWRRYTGTQRIQITVSLVAVGLLLAVFRFNLPVGEVPVLAGVAVVWIVSLLGLGVRNRRHWNSMVEGSTFRKQQGTRKADLERLNRYRNVLVSTEVPGLLSQTHTNVIARVSDVDAEFTITIEYVGSGGRSEGLTTGNDALDETFVIEGTEQNVAQVLSTDVQAALLDIETPGTCTITGKRVVYDVPFTRLSASELDTIADATVEIADRVEEAAKAG